MKAMFYMEMKAMFNLERRFRDEGYKGEKAYEAAVAERKRLIMEHEDLEWWKEDGHTSGSSSSKPSKETAGKVAEVD